jgi:hypothetical protein
MAQRSLLIDTRHGQADKSVAIEDPSWEDVETAIHQLDGIATTSVVLGEMGLRTISGSGGPMDFVVEAHWVDGLGQDCFATLTGLDSEGTVRLVAGGQLGEFPRSWIVDRTTAIGAFRHYYDHGVIESDSRWRLR